MKTTTGMLTILLIATVLAGCLGGDDDQLDAALDWLPCEHPYPCGDGSEWPLGLEGPFDVSRVQIDRVQVLTHDGVPLDGWVFLPDVTVEIALPAVLIMNVYVGGLVEPEDGPPFIREPLPDDPAFIRDSHYMGPLQSLLENGYAIAVFSPRGSGNSGGCAGPWWHDPPVLIDWIAGQPWSNGRVAMMGQSNLALWSLAGAVSGHGALKAVAIGGFGWSLYEAYHSPQGVPNFMQRSAVLAAAGVLGGTVSPMLNHPEYGIAGQSPFLADRACAERLDRLVGDQAALFMDDRNEALWSRWSLAERLQDVTSAVLYTHSFHSDITWSTDTFWERLPNAPKRGIQGWDWGHTFDFDAHLAAYPGGESFARTVVDWFDFWLKGIGDPPRLGMVDYQDSERAWHTSTSWPPTEARQEVLYLREGVLSPVQRDASPATFHAVAASASNAPCEGLIPAGVPGLWSLPPPICMPHPMCHDDDPSSPSVGAVFTSDTVTQRVVIAGNPFAYLSLTSDAEGGLFVLDMYDLGPRFECRAGEPVDATPMGAIPFLGWGRVGGAADLRFLHGNFVAEPFPVNVPTPVRIDHTNTAYVLEPGHRLALVVGTNHALGIGTPASQYAPLITLYAEGGTDSSHIVIPVIEGTFGGEAPSVEYAPRPFTSRGE